MKVTIKDIAREAGVSISAVSLVLNKKPCRISKEKRDEIERIAQKYHYQANQIARSLAMKETKTLGLIIPDIGNLFFSAYAKFLEDYCRQKGYLLFIASSNEKFEVDLELLELFSARSVDGLFLTMSMEAYAHTQKLSEALSHLRFPYVMVDRFLKEDLGKNIVSYDHEEGGYLATRHLIEMGHRKIGCVTPARSYGSGEARFLGYKRAMEAFGLSIEPSWLFEGDYQMESGFHAAEKLVANTTASFVSNDMMSLGFLRFLHTSHLAVPKDYSLVSYDNVTAPYIIDLSLTVVEQNITTLGKTAAEMLFTQIAEKSAEPGDAVFLLPELRLGKSVSPL